MSPAVVIARSIHEAVSLRLAGVDQRYTHLRRILVETLAAAGRPLTIPEIVASAPELPQSSAYRNMTALIDVGCRPQGRRRRRSRPLRAGRGALGPPPPLRLRDVRKGGGCPSLTEVGTGARRGGPGGGGGTGLPGDRAPARPAGPVSGVPRVGSTKGHHPGASRGPRRGAGSPTALRRLEVGTEFRRLWTLYLAYCEAAFLERHVSDVQIVLAKPSWRGQLGARAV